MGGYADALEIQQFLATSMATPAMREYLARMPSTGGMARQTEIEITVGLAQAEPYYWSGDLTRVVGEMARTLPDLALSCDMVPARFGFFWFPEPAKMPAFLPETDEERSLTAICAISWSALEEDNGQTYVVVGPVDDPSFALLSVTFWSSHKGRIAPIGCYRWPPGMTYNDLIDRMIASGVLPHTRAWKIERVRFFAACLLFLHQQVYVADRRHVDRATRRRLERADWTGQTAVRVVRLRRLARPDNMTAGETTEQREWSCQWLVRGHWRQQPYPSEGVARPLYIAPYVKGDPTKPLKPPSRQVFAVVR